MIYGPFAVVTHAADGSLTTTGAAGVHYTADVATYAAHLSLLQPYRASHAWPLQFVMAGDDPASPSNSVPLVFADQATADGVLAQL